MAFCEKNWYLSPQRRIMSGLLNSPSGPVALTNSSQQLGLWLVHGDVKFYLVAVHSGQCRETFAERRSIFMQTQLFWQNVNNEKSQEIGAVLLKYTDIL